MAALRFVHNYDIVFCEKGGNNHKGANPTFDVHDDEVYAEGGEPRQYRIVTDSDLLKVTLDGCPDAKGKSTKIASIIEGRADHVKIHGKIPLLVNLVAVEAGTGHVIRVATTYAERMAAHEGAKKHVYSDNSPQHYKTVGIGFNMEKKGAKGEFDALLGLPSSSTLFDDVLKGKANLTQDQMVTLVEQGKPSFEAGARAAVSAPVFDALSPERQAALTELQANTKNGVGGFSKMVTAIKNDDLPKASYELLHGKSGLPSVLVGTGPGGVGPGRANNYAASLRWNVFSTPEEPSFDPAEGVDDPASPSFDPSKAT